MNFNLMKLLLLYIIGFFSVTLLYSQNGKDTSSDTLFKDMGVAVSPSSFHLSMKPGSSAVKEITVNNDTKNNYKFNVGTTDFEMNKQGDPVSSPGCKYALSKWMTISPTYFELKPHQKQKIKLLITIPDTAFFAAWSIVALDQVSDRPKLDVEPSDKNIAFGVINTIGFGVYVFQNPPNVKINNVEIKKFTLSEKDSVKIITMEVKNTGDGIGYSTAYVELTNLNNGKTQKLPVTRFTILPQFEREFSFLIPKIIEKGKYSVVGVLDFGSKEEIKAAELEFEIQ